MLVNLTSLAKKPHFNCAGSKLTFLPQLKIKFVSKTNATSVRISRFRRCSDYSGLTIVQTIFGKLLLILESVTA